MLHEVGQAVEVAGVRELPRPVHRHRRAGLQGGPVAHQEHLYAVGQRQGFVPPHRGVGRGVVVLVARGAQEAAAAAAAGRAAGRGRRGGRGAEQEVLGARPRRAQRRPGDRPGEDGAPRHELATARMRRRRPLPPAPDPLARRRRPSPRRRRVRAVRRAPAAGPAGHLGDRARRPAQAVPARPSRRRAREGGRRPAGPRRATARARRGRGRGGRRGRSAWVASGRHGPSSLGRCLLSRPS